MRLTTVLLAALVPVAAAARENPPADDAAVLRKIHDAALVDSPMFGQLTELVEKFPGRLSGSGNLAGAVLWARAELARLGCDRVELQPVKVPHWERGAPERAAVRTAAGGSVPLALLALGNSAATPPEGLTAEVVEVKSLDELSALGRDRVAGRIVFFNRPMDRRHISNAPAYRGAVDQRTRGPALASQLGAQAALVRSMTFADDDVPHTGNTAFPEGVHPIPAAALGVQSAETLSRLAREPGAMVALQIHARTLPDALSHNVIGEVRGTELPEKVILVGGHLDSWDIAPGAHDDGAGCVQSLEVLRILRAIGYRPRHTLRVVLFTNEENGIRGATEYARVVGEQKEVHVLALESDSGGFAPHGFNLGNAAGDAHVRAERWLPLFQPYNIHFFRAGTGGVDVAPLLRFGYTVAGPTQDAPRYFDYHHTAIDALDKVNARELSLGAAAMASLVYLFDRHGP